MDKTSECLGYYQGIGHENINGALRESVKDADIEPYVLHCILLMDSIMSKKNAGTIVYRGVNNLEKLIETMDTAGFSTTLVDKGFSSCSTDIKISQKFTTDKCCILKFVIGNDISSVSLSKDNDVMNYKEKEILLQRNLDYSIFAPYHDTLTGYKIYPCTVKPAVRIQVDEETLSKLYLLYPRIKEITDFDLHADLPHLLGSS